MELKYKSKDLKIPKDKMEGYNKILMSCEFESMCSWANSTLKEHAKQESLKKIAPWKWSFFKSDDTAEKAKIEQFFTELEDTIAAPVTKPSDYEYLVLKFKMERGAVEVCKEEKGVEEAVRLEILKVAVNLG